MVTAAEIWQGLEEVKDPEIPVVSLVEMGIIRDVTVGEDGRVVVKMTPTFSGCPALHVMRADIEKKVMALGATAVSVETVLSPPWTTDWISDEARQKLKEFGLAPPMKHGGNLEITLYDLAACPYCDSNNTSIKNTFGPTLCRAIYYCNDCRQPFEQFKAL
jgi:ring-1,2-phenylacetyl-CoA epoxidase subunit PaaD